MKRLFVILLLMTAACGGPDSLFEKAERRERGGIYTKAISLYRQFIDRYPNDERVPEAIFRIAEIFRCDLQIYSEAKDHYKNLLLIYGKDDQWALKAQRGLLLSPSFFPMQMGSHWVEGDSLTGGKNMNAEITVSTVSALGKACFEKIIYAGKVKFSEVSQCYEMVGERIVLLESKGKKRTFLQYPFTMNQKWTGGINGATTYTIEDDDAEVRVQAGTFKNCLKVKEHIRGFPSWTYSYYAPHVGKVLATVATRQKESRNVELLHYEIPSQGRAQTELFGRQGG